MGVTRRGNFYVRSIGDRRLEITHCSFAFEFRGATLPFTFGILFLLHLRNSMERLSFMLKSEWGSIDQDIYSLTFTKAEALYTSLDKALKQRNKSFKLPRKLR